MTTLMPTPRHYSAARLFTGPHSSVENKLAYPMEAYQRTPRRTVSCAGVGLHSGKDVHLTIKPAPPNSGIRFIRADLGGRSVAAHMDKVVNTTLATTLAEGDCLVSTTEHLLAALRGCGIDNADIELDGPEVPIMDGSAAPFCDLLRQAGCRRQNASRIALRITQPIHHEENGKRLAVFPFAGFTVFEEIVFDDDIIQRQIFSSALRGDNFLEHIAPARTFGRAEDVEMLWARGLALGGTLDNVVTIHWNRKSVLNEGGLRFPNEFVRHKALDLIGDLTLLGFPLLARVHAFKAGHGQHLGLMRAIVASPDCWEWVRLSPDGNFKRVEAVAM
ncbi:MAG: UDP-3-O-acyl-N-acetylglucosamine deacetylase [Desulfobulbaceae bacterium]|jgi:UDP-3-O-[3-hydroxymyristoyl] N-acetylglucosamine deacetylase|nr:UDP-3-O-acyl-N-acetylglucosamine deacetylase [Desulfobulbaceae bacterium]